MAGRSRSKAFRVLPESAQAMVLDALQGASQSLPEMVGVVQRRIQRWKKVQRNSSAQSSPQGHASKPKPDKRDADVATKGKDAAVHGHAGEAVNAQIAQQPLARLTNEMVGISGEHIADYICAENFGWGTEWRGHDSGEQGHWADGTPSATKASKLSKGGDPKKPHILYKLTDGANGTGIDAVWRADGRNGGKPYAIVEAKATRDEDAPKFMRRPNNTRKPSITSTLGANAITDPSELLEPLEEDAAKKPQKSGGGKSGGKSGTGKTSRVAPTGALPRSDASGPSSSSGVSRKTVRVQMSQEWIEANMAKAVGASLAVEVLRKLPGDNLNYSRHLFFRAMLNKVPRIDSRLKRSASI